MHLRSRLLLASFLATVCVCACGSDDPDDNTLPIVTISAPPGGTVSGIVTLTATATDNHRVAYVRWRVNTGLVALVDSTPPYEYSWDTSTFAAGFYDWEALATDPSGNTGISPAVEYTIAP